MTESTEAVVCATCGGTPHGWYLCEHCGARRSTGLHGGRGPLPPPVPRQLDESLRRDITHRLNALRRVGTGLLWGIVTTPVGLVLRRRGLQQARRTLEVLERGAVAPGVLTGVRVDHTVGIDERHPLRLDYRFTLPDHSEREGFVRVWSPGQIHRHPGEPTWIVYLPHDPAASAPWPPLR